MLELYRHVSAEKVRVRINYMIQKLAEHLEFISLKDKKLEELALII